MPTLAPLPSGAPVASSTPAAHFVHPHGCQISAQGFKVRAIVEAAWWQLDLVEWEPWRTDTVSKTPPEAKLGETKSLLPPRLLHHPLLAEPGQTPAG